MYNIGFSLGAYNIDTELDEGKFYIPAPSQKLKVVSVGSGVESEVLPESEDFTQTESPVEKVDIEKESEKAIEASNTKEQGRTVKYAPAGKSEQIYTIRGNKIYNSKNKEVFKEDSVDRNKILANLAVQEKRAVVVEHKDNKYVVNKKGVIISVTSGKVMQWGEENGDRKAIISLAEEKFNPVEKSDTKELTEESPLQQEGLVFDSVDDFDKLIEEEKKKPVNERLANKVITTALIKAIEAGKIDLMLKPELLQDISSLKTQISDEKRTLSHSQAMEIFKQYFPESAMSLEDVSNVLGKLSYLPEAVILGVYDGLVRFAHAGVANSTPYFEGFRLVFNALITDKERENIYMEATLKYLGGKTKQEKNAILAEFQRTYVPLADNGYLYNGKELLEYYLETMLAKEFVKKAEKKESKSFIQRFFNKLLEWLGLGSKTNALFDRILRGEFEYNNYV